MTPVELEEPVDEGAGVEEVVVAVEDVVVDEGVVPVPALVETVVELNGTKKGLLSWVTRPNPVRATGLPYLTERTYQRPSE